MRMWRSGCASVFQTDEMGSIPIIRSFPPVAQWSAQRSYKAQVLGSTPSGRTKAGPAVTLELD